VAGDFSFFINLRNMFSMQDKTLIMGIVNVTPDSFSDGGEYFSPDTATSHALQLVDDGADILDLGAESTRPGAEPVPAIEQIRRLEPVVRGLVDQVDVPISIDTTKSEVAKKMLDIGAGMVNDISGLQFDPKMVEVVASRQCPVVIMHISGDPQTMQNDPKYDDVIGEISHYFMDRIEVALSSGINESQIILDPGIGFGKTVEHNYEIIRGIPKLKALGYPILLGASRKSFIGKTLDLPIEERLEGSLATAVLGSWLGADILRVHDVKETVRAVRMTDAIQRKKDAVN